MFYVRLILDGEIEESEEGGLVRLGRVADSEHGHERAHRRRQLAPTPVRGLGEAADFLSALELGILVVGFDKLQSALDG